MRGLFLKRKTADLQRSVARDFAGVGQIRLYFLFSFFGGRGFEEGGGRKTLERNIMVYHKKVSHYTTFILTIT